ncbi:YaaC family protein [Rhizorhabdus histidinilytica]|uniref:YaaC family protein n=1 Tax=Rhizorhabdus histidinilytica TaxID=439228 RepID=UPI00158FE822|nr:YaaC family protein [Rhizorhabdus histidinilytica]
MSDEIRISDRPVRFARATCAPGFREKRIISSTPWEYVSLWLRKQHLVNAEIYWNQARNFFDAARDLPTESAPLPLYYAFLNATKTLLEAKGVAYNPYHGVAGFDMRTAANGRIRLDNEGIKIKGSGVLPSLISYFGEMEAARTYALGDVLSNLAFIHRAYSVSYSRNELFLSIANPRYVRSGVGQARFEADLPIEHCHGQTVRTFPAGYRKRELTEAEWEAASFDSSRHVIETINTFAWSGARRPTDADITSLCAFHRELRLEINYISGERPNWYLKRYLANTTRIQRNNLTLMFMAMHRFSEIARYKPVELNRLLEGGKNWLIYEFVEVARNQFIDEIAAEITGHEISPAGVRQSSF